MRNPWQIWLAFAACLGVALVAAGWMTLKAVQLDRAETAARRQASLEENARLALWRMDSQMTTLLAEENARPYFQYSATYLAESPYLELMKHGEIVVNSPLALQSSPLILFHFQFEKDGTVSSPQVSTPDNKSGKKGERSANQRRMAELAKSLDPRVLLASLPAVKPELAARPNLNGMLPGQLEAQAPRQQQQVRASNEYQIRQQYVAEQNFAVNGANFAAPLNIKVGAEVQTTPMTPRWQEGQLLLLRRVTQRGQSTLQGCLLNWPAIQRQLLTAVQDLLPAAQLRPVPVPTAAEQALLMATLPVLLEPGPATLLAEENPSPLKISLAAAWLSLLVAAVAVAALLQGVISLSERRAAFVSAVTHELRTPLTTFRMYAEMLAEGMVSGEDQRQQYLHTLRTEADRLTHLVQNVLAYARLERGRAQGHLERLRVEQLLEPAQERLSQRAEQAQLHLVVEADQRTRERTVLADSAAVEQILFNLVDNACKYAAGAADRLLHLEATASDGQVLLRLRDHGPGVADRYRRSLFQPFRKSADEAARSAPGVGLGLALSRRLARAMGGDLTYQAGAGGGCFELRLRAAR